MGGPQKSVLMKFYCISNVIDCNFPYYNALVTNMNKILCIQNALSCILVLLSHI